MSRAVCQLAGLARTLYHWRFVSVCLLVGFASMPLAASHGEAQEDAGTEVKPPEVTIQVIVTDKSFERGESGHLILVIANASGSALTSVTLSGLSDSFELTGMPPFDIRPFDSATKELQLKAGDGAPFGDTTFGIEARYSWTDPDNQAHTSSKVASIDLKVKRRLEDEAGVVQGGAAILYFFLPILLVLFSFGISWSLLVNRQFPPALPKSDLGAVPFLVILAALTYGAFDRWDWLEYSGDLPSNDALLKMLIFTAPAGLAIPGAIFVGRLARDVITGHWRFSGDETAEEVINKALTGPYRRTDFEWVTCSARGTTWEGILLEEGPNYFVLGSTLQAAPEEGLQQTFEEKILTKAGEVIDRVELAKMARTNQLITLGVVDYLKQAEQPVERIARKVHFKYETCERKPTPLVKAPD